MDFEKEALDRLTQEYSKGSFNVRASAMKAAVRDALVTFIRQDEEFAQAVAQSKGSFAGCMEAVAKGVGSSISDLEAYRRAVQYYFPGAEIQFHMTVDLIGAAAGEAHKEAHQEDSGKKAVILDLTDFL